MCLVVVTGKGCRAYLDYILAKEVGDEEQEEGREERKTRKDKIESS